MNRVPPLLAGLCNNTIAVPLQLQDSSRPGLGMRGQVPSRAPYQALNPQLGSGPTPKTAAPNKVRAHHTRCAIPLLPSGSGGVQDAKLAGPHQTGGTCLARLSTCVQSAPAHPLYAGIRRRPITRKKSLPFGFRGTRCSRYNSSLGDGSSRSAPRQLQSRNSGSRYRAESETCVEGRTRRHQAATTDAQQCRLWVRRLAR